MRSKSCRLRRRRSASDGHLIQRSGLVGGARRGRWRLAYSWHGVRCVHFGGSRLCGRSLLFRCFWRCCRRRGDRRRRKDACTIGEVPPEQVGPLRRDASVVLVVEYFTRLWIANKRIEAVEERGRVGSGNEQPLFLSGYVCRPVSLQSCEGPAQTRRTSLWDARGCRRSLWRKMASTAANRP